MLVDQVSQLQWVNVDTYVALEPPDVGGVAVVVMSGSVMTPPEVGVMVTTGPVRSLEAVVGGHEVDAPAPEVETTGGRETTGMEMMLSPSSVFCGSVEDTTGRETMPSPSL